MIRTGKGLLAAALTLPTVSVLLAVSGTGAHAATGTLRSGDYEPVLTSGPAAEPVAVRDVASGAPVLAEQRPMQSIIKDGGTPSDVSGRYTTVASDGDRLVGAGEVRSRNGSVFRFRDTYGVAPGAEVRQWTCTGAADQQWAVA